MKMYITSTGGPSPAMTIHTSREDVLQFADRIRAEAEKPSDAEFLRFLDLHVGGEHYEAIEFKLVRDVQPLIDARLKKERWWPLPVALFWIAVLGILYLAYRGLLSL
jgi:hypothetical protein